MEYNVHQVKVECFSCIVKKQQKPFGEKGVWRELHLKKISSETLNIKTKATKFSSSVESEKKDQKQKTSLEVYPENCSYFSDKT